MNRSRRNQALEIKAEAAVRGTGGDKILPGLTQQRKGANTALDHCFRGYDCDEAGRLRQEPAELMPGRTRSGRTEPRPAA